MELRFQAKFEGRDADNNRLEAYPTAQSLEGLSWALAVTLHYGVTGDLRARGDLSRSAKIYFSPSRRGSFVQDIFIEIQQNPWLLGIVGGYAANTVTPYINGLIGYTFNQTIGAAKVIPRGAAKFIRKLNGDDLDELAVRIEPPLTRAHTAIGKTAETVTFKSRRTPLVLMNPITKGYLEARLTDEFETIDTNVTSFNLLTGNGRLYFLETEGTVPFSVHSTIGGDSRNALIRSMEHYSLGHEGKVRITAQRFETSDERIKKFVITSAEEVPQADWVQGRDPLRSRRT